MRGERIASRSEVIRAIVSGCCPCCGGPHRGEQPLDREEVLVVDAAAVEARDGLQLQ